MSVKKTLTTGVLDDQLPRAIAQRGGVRSWPANVVLASEDDRSDALYILLAVPEKLAQQDIAERVGSSRAMVSRILKPLQEGGCIELRGGHITLPKKLPARW